MEKECDSFKKYFAEMLGTMTLVLLALVFLFMIIPPENPLLRLFY